MPPTRINPRQINLNLLFSVKDILLSKGFVVSAEGQMQDTLLKFQTISEHDLYGKNLMFDVFNKLEYRIQLLDYIIKESPLNDSLISEFAEHPDFKKNRKSFSNSFEWYIGELMVRNFSAFSSSYGVIVSNIQRNSDGEFSGDFDTLVVQRNLNLIYFECKSGSYKARDIRNAIERGISLHTEFVVFVIHNKINESSLNQSIKTLPTYDGWEKLIKISIKDSNSSVYHWDDCFFISASENIEDQIRTILRVNSARSASNNRSVALEPTWLNRQGYLCEEIGIEEGE
jgi:hypothetical protein